jgi:hypothetical protein
MICKNFEYSLDVEDTNNLKDSINKLVSDIKVRRKYDRDSYN